MRDNSLSVDNHMNRGDVETSDRYEGCFKSKRAINGPSDILDVMSESPGLGDNLEGLIGRLPDSVVLDLIDSAVTYTKPLNATCEKVREALMEGWEYWEGVANND